jgi:thioester reductase-like protein
MGRPLKVLLTGGTGFLGEYLLAELLERGHSVWALYRSESRKLDTLRFLSSFGLPHSAESLHWFKCELLELADKWSERARTCKGLLGVDTLLHSAASTKLHLDETGEPVRTNAGSARVLRTLTATHPMRVHLVSTAYVCGAAGRKRVYEVNHPRGAFLNVYEESKWEAEQLWAGEATILRPSIIVGDSETGRSTNFAGVYIMFQAAHLLSRLLDEFQGIDRHHLELEVPGDAEGEANIIPVDYVAKAIVRLIEQPEHHNKVYHLTHPNPPVNRLLMDVVCSRFNFGGIKFVGEGAQFSAPRNRVERMVLKQMEAIRRYFPNNPIFDRSNTDTALPDLRPPAVDETYLRKILDYALERNWGQDPQ